MINLYDSVMILKNIPEEGVTMGELGHVIDIFENGKAYTVEFVTNDGMITGLVTDEAQWFSRYVREVSAAATENSTQSTSVSFGGNRSPAIVVSGAFA